MAVVPKDRPQNDRHSEHQAYIRDVRKIGPLLALPKFGSAMPTAWAESGFAGVWNNLLLEVRRKDLCSQDEGTAIDYFVEVIADHRAELAVVPEVPSVKTCFSGSLIIEGQILLF